MSDMYNLGVKMAEQGSCGGTPKRDGSGGGIGNFGTLRQPKPEIGPGAKIRVVNKKKKDKENDVSTKESSTPNKEAQMRAAFDEGFKGEFSKQSADKVDARYEELLGKHLTVGLSEAEAAELYAKMYNSPMREGATTALSSGLISGLGTYAVNRGRAPGLALATGLGAGGAFGVLDGIAAAARNAALRKEFGLSPAEVDMYRNKKETKESSMTNKEAQMRAAFNEGFKEEFNKQALTRGRGAAYGAGIGGALGGAAALARKPKPGERRKVLRSILLGAGAGAAGGAALGGGDRTPMEKIKSLGDKSTWTGLKDTLGKKDTWTGLKDKGVSAARDLGARAAKAKKGFTGETDEVIEQLQNQLGESVLASGSAATNHKLELAAVIAAMAHAAGDAAGNKAVRVNSLADRLSGLAAQKAGPSMAGRVNAAPVPSIAR